MFPGSALPLDNIALSTDNECNLSVANVAGWPVPENKGNEP